MQILQSILYKSKNILFPFTLPFLRKIKLPDTNTKSVYNICYSQFFMSAKVSTLYMVTSKLTSENKLTLTNV